MAPGAARQGRPWGSARRGASVPRLSRASLAVLLQLAASVRHRRRRRNATASRGWKECAAALDMVGASGGFVWTVCALS